MDPISIFLLTAAGAAGAVAGSFLNVVIIRGERNETLTGRSRCESCRKTLTPAELIPILSFIIQKGRCRRCSTALLRQYPLVEGATAAGYVISTWLILQRLPVGGEFFFVLLASFFGIGAAIVVLVSDWKYYLIPNGALAILLILGGLALFFRHQNANVSSLALDLGSTLLLSFFLVLLWLVSGGRWMGLGDGKLFFVASLLLGFPVNLSAFLFSFWLGALVGGGLLLAGKKDPGGIIPFGPFILAGSAVAWLWGETFLRFTGLLSLLLL